MNNSTPAIRAVLMSASTVIVAIIHLEFVSSTVDSAVIAEVIKYRQSTAQLRTIA